MEAEMLIERKYLIQLDRIEADALLDVLRSYMKQIDEAEEPKETVGEIHLAERLIGILSQR